jgi:lipopolysaccharide transport system ATP-binding protein
MMPVVKGKGHLALHLERLDLNSGKYYVDVGIYEKNWKYAYDFHWHVYPILINSDFRNKGVISPPYRWDFGGVEGISPTK